MKTLLQLNTSFSPPADNRQLADNFVATWKANNAGRASSCATSPTNPLPHLDAEHFLAIAQPAGALRASRNSPPQPTR